MDSWFELAQLVLVAIQAFTAIVIMRATIRITHYTKVTVDEGKKNRRKGNIENKLKEAYSPLYELLRRAHIDDGLRTAVRQTSPEKKFVFTEEEFARVWSIVETFGSHLGSQERMALTNALREDRPTIHDIKILAEVRWHRFEGATMSGHYDHVLGTCRDLMKELDQLTQL